MSKAPAKAKDKDAADEVAPKSKKKLIIIVAAVLLASAGGAAGWHFLGPKPHTKEVHKEPPKPPVFLPLETFTLNLQPEGSENFLQATLVVQVEDEKASESLKLYMPMVRNRLLQLLSSKTAEELSTLDGKKKLTAEVLAQLKTPMDKGGEPIAVKDVLFNDFVIQ